MTNIPTPNFIQIFMAQFLAMILFENQCKMVGQYLLSSMLKIINYDPPPQTDEDGPKTKFCISDC